MSQPTYFRHLVWIRLVAKSLRHCNPHTTLSRTICICVFLVAHHFNQNENHCTVADFSSSLHRAENATNIHTRTRQSRGFKLCIYCDIENKADHVVAPEQERQKNTHRSHALHGALRSHHFWLRHRFGRKPFPGVFACDDLYRLFFYASVETTSFEADFEADDARSRRCGTDVRHRHQFSPRVELF